MWNATGPDSNRDPPPGVTPNYENPTDVNRTANIVVIALCDLFITVFFIIRIYVKSTINRRIMTEDWTCAIAYVLIILLSVAIFLMSHYGAGYHAWDVPLPEYYNMLKWLYATTVIYCPAAFFTKVTILLLMARVFAIEEKVARGIRIFIWCLLICYIPVEIVWAAICIPIRTLWDPTVENPRCLNQRKVFFSSLALSILTDVIILIVPIPLTWTLRMPLRKKIKIIMLLSAGGAATGLTVYRTTRAAKFLDSDDITVDFVMIGILSCLELTIGFVCACLPSLNVLIEHHFSRRGRESPNQPRTREMHTSTPRKSLRGSTTRTTEASPRCGIDPAQNDNQPQNQNQNQNQPTRQDFDVELAMLTGQPVKLSTRQSESLESVDSHLLRARIDSVDGRQEGWLSRNREALERAHGADYIMNMVERSKILSEQEGRGAWCPVWDGPREHLGKA